MSKKALLEKRNDLAKRIRQLADLANSAEHSWTGENEENWKALNADFDGVGAQIERLERAETVERVIVEEDEARETRRAGIRPTLDRLEPEDEREERAEPTEEDKALALQAWMRAQTGEHLTKRHVEACQRTGMNPRRKYFRAKLYDTRSYHAHRREYRALSTAATAGGDTIPVGFVNNFERALLEYNDVRSVAEVIRTASGNALHWPTVNDTGNEGALLAENAQVTEQDIVTSEMVLNAYKYTSKLIRVSAELLQDSAFDLAQIIGSMLGERIARIQQTAFTTGTGSSQPKGIVTAATTGKTTASATAITGDEIIDLIHSVDPAYRRDPSVGFMMHDSILLYVRKLKDGQSNYLWEDDFTAGQAGRLKGYPITINQKMASTVATTNKTIIFGALRYYKIRDVASVRMRRLVERYADYDQEAFVAFMRSDGDLLDAGTHPVKVMVQA